MTTKRINPLVFSINADYQWVNENQGDRFLDEFGEFNQKPVPLILQDGTPVRMVQDIWKFQPDEYYAKWLENSRKVQELPKWKRKLLYYGLKEVNRIGTPVITRTQWHK